MAAIIREEAEPLPAGVPAPLRWVVERLLAKEPVERYDSTRDLYRELKQIRDRLSETTSAAQTAAPAATRTPRRAIIAALFGAACLAAGFLQALLLVAPSAADLSSYRFTPLARDETENRAPAWSPDGGSIAYIARIHGVEQVFTRAVGSPDAAQLTKATQDCSSPSWSRDSTTLYYISGRNLWSVPASGGAAQLVLEHADGATIHPDGKKVVFARNGKLWVASLDGGPVKEFWAGPVQTGGHGIFGGIRFSPDGATVAADAGSGEIWLLPYPTGKARKLYAMERSNYLESLGWFPDGRSLVVSLYSSGGTGARIRLSIRDGSRRTIYSAASVLGYGLRYRRMAGESLIPPDKSNGTWWKCRSPMEPFTRWHAVRQPANGPTGRPPARIFCTPLYPRERTRSWTRMLRAEAFRAA